MKLRFETLFRGYLFLLVGLLVWAVWASAQTPSSTNAAPLPASEVDGDAGGFGASAGAPFLRLNEDHLTFGLQRIPWLREHSLLGEPLWKYLAFVIYLFLAFYVSKLLDYLVQVLLRRWAARTQTRLDDLLLGLLHGPIKVIAFVVFVHVGLNLFTWQGWVKQYLSNGLKIVVAISLTYVALRFVDLLLGFWEQREVDRKNEQFHKQLFPILRKIIAAFVLVVAFLVTAPHLGLNITGLIASLSIGGLAIGLAAQDTLANLFGAVAILVDKPFHVGDRIVLDNVDGVVESIGFRSTRVRNLDGHVVTIPNKTVGNATITNIALRPNIRTIINLGITYDCPPEKIQRAVDIVKEVFGRHPNTHDLIVSFNKFADFSLNLQVIHWWNNTDFRAYLAGLQQMNLEVKRRFDEAGIGFAFPTQTLHVKQDSDWRFEPAAPPVLSAAATPGLAPRVP